MKKLWAIAIVHCEPDGMAPLVDIKEFYKSEQEAKDAAKKIAEEAAKAAVSYAMESFGLNIDELGNITFNDIWEEVDDVAGKGRNMKVDYGFDPVDDVVDWRIRVVPVKVTVKGATDGHKDKQDD